MFNAAIVPSKGHPRRHFVVSLSSDSTFYLADTTVDSRIKRYHELTCMCSDHIMMNNDIMSNAVAIESVNTPQTHFVIFIKNHLYNTIHYFNTLFIFKSIFPYRCDQ